MTNLAKLKIIKHPNEKIFKKIFSRKLQTSNSQDYKKNNNLVINNNFKIIQIKNEKFIQNKKKE